MPVPPAIPTYIITGFLGTGKTTAISHLLRHKPAHERWAVLVNEFGEVGIDGSLLQAQQGTDSGVTIKEVPGGCMCCAAGVPVRIALNMLLARARPDRLLIEPSGLGHPLEIIELLRGEYYHDVLALQGVATLLDARCLDNPRYREHPTWQQQLQVASCIVANKTDRYRPDDYARLTALLQAVGQAEKPLHFTQDGAIELAWLSSSSEADSAESESLSTDEGIAADALEASVSARAQSLEPGSMLGLQRSPAAAGELAALPAGTWRPYRGQHDGLLSLSWRMSSDLRFNRAALRHLFYALEVDRLKALVLTSEGAFFYNKVGDVLTEQALTELDESRIELICQQVPNEVEAQLLACLR